MAKKVIYLMAKFQFFALFLLAVSAFADEYIVMDDETEVFIAEIVDKIKDALGYESEIRVYISSDQTINASAIQTGDIVINAGAIIQSENFQEVIGIIAHEVGHIEGRHILQIISHSGNFVKAGLVPALIGAVTAICSGSAAPLIAGIAGGQSISQRMMLGKLRQKEHIADTKAAAAINKLKWPVFGGFVSMHKKLEAKSIIYNEYLSTHPISSKRISKYKEYYEKSKSWVVSDKVKKLMKKYEERFKIIQKKLKALTIQKEFLRDLYKNPKDNNEKYARAVALYRMSKYSEAIKLIDELPKENKENSAYYAEIKCMALINLKRCQEAAEIAKANLQSIRMLRDHRDLAVIYAEAVIAGNLRDHTGTAINYTEKLLFPRDDDLNTLNELGKLYNMSGNSQKASLCAAKIAFEAGDMKMAEIHAKKAAVSNDKKTCIKAQDILNSVIEAKNDNNE